MPSVKSLSVHVQRRRFANSDEIVLLQELRDKYAAVVKMIDSGDKLKLDQNHVETVIPAPGEPPEPPLTRERHTEC